LIGGVWERLRTSTPSNRDEKRLLVDPLSEIASKRIARLTLRGMVPWSPRNANLATMNDSRLHRLWRAITDWWSFQTGTIEGWFDRTPETPEDRAIREEGKRIRKAFPSIDFNRPGARKRKSEEEHSVE